MRERKPHFITSLYVPDSKKDVMKKLEELAWRERKDLSPLIMTAIEEYLKVHGEGNPSYDILKWADEPNFKAYPAFASERKKWMEHLMQSNQKEIQHIYNQSGMIKEMASRYLDMIRRGQDITKTYLG